MSDAIVSRSTYASIRSDQRAKLIERASQELTGDAAALLEAIDLFNSETEISDADALFLGMINVFTIGVNTGEDDITVTRRRGNAPKNLDAWLAGLNGGACNLDPDAVVYIRDADGDEVMVTDEDGDEIPLAEVRGNAAASGSGVSVRTASGKVFHLEDGRRVSLSDVGGSMEAYRAIAEFSRDGGETWQDVRWTLTLPKPRKA